MYQTFFLNVYVFVYTLQMTGVCSQVIYDDDELRISCVRILIDKMRYGGGNKQKRDVTTRIG